MFKKLGDLLSDQEYQSQQKNNQQRKEAPKFDEGDGLDFLGLIDAWEDIVGKGLAQNTIPLKNTRKILTILTNHSAYSQQLSFMEIQLREKILRRFPKLKGKVKKLAFQASSAYFDQKKSDLLAAAATRALKKKTSSPPKEKSSLFHQYNPRYKMLYKEGLELLKDIKDPDTKEKLLSIFIQSQKDTQ